MKKKITVLFLVFSVSCGNKKLVSYDEIRKQFGNYIVNHDQSSLKRSYHTLIKKEDFKTNGITSQNLDLVIPIFFKLKKHDELIKLLKNTSILSDYYREFYINLAKYLSLRCVDSLSANTFINNNLSLINNQILNNQNDSILYVDYYTCKLYVSDLESVLKEVDSLQNVNHKFTSDFYDYILTDALIEFYPEIEKCK